MEEFIQQEIIKLKAQLETYEFLLDKINSKKKLLTQKQGYQLEIALFVVQHLKLQNKEKFIAVTLVKLNFVDLNLFINFRCHLSGHYT